MLGGIFIGSMVILSWVYAAYHTFKRRSTSQRSSGMTPEQVYVANNAISAYNRTQSPVKYTKVCDAEIVQLDDGRKMIKLSQSETIHAEKNFILQ